MLPELGQIALILALLVAMLQALLPLLGAHSATGATGAKADNHSPRNRSEIKQAWMAVSRPAAYTQLLLVAIAFAVLTHAFVVQDFSLQYVVQNSNSLLPWYYRYTAVWGAHEGSLLLWALILAVWTAAVARFSRRLPDVVVARVLGVMGLIAVGFLAFLIFTSNPFLRLLPAIAEGRDLNPLLQDPGMIIHPPMLYLGYVGFSVPFAFAIAALLDGNVVRQDQHEREWADWLRWIRPWTNIAWGLLTIGIALGSWWAYYELGWGGWWFWDPVENASFMPWLAGTALLHSQAVTEKRGSFAGWTLLLAIATFSLSLLGTFLVRSGVLTSVHAFAADPTRGLFVLIFLAIVIGGSLLLYALRAPGGGGARFAASSRETLLLINNLLLVAACAMVLLGSLYPLLADALGLGKISVGPPYFALLFLVLMAPLVLLLPLGPLTRWQREQASRPLAMLVPWAGLALGIGIAAFFLAPQGRWKTAAGLAGAAWVLAGTARFAWARLVTNSKPFTAEMLGMTLAHLGVAVFLVGALLTEGLSQQRELALAPGQSIALAGREFRFEGVKRRTGPNYLADYGTVQVLRGNAPPLILHPEKRSYASGGQVLTEAAIAPGILGDVYVALGESLDAPADTPKRSLAAGSWALRVHVKPFVRWIWLGAALMALGGFVTATDRRFRAVLRRSPEADAQEKAA